VTIAKRPFVWVGMAADIEVIWVKSEPEYFCEEDWTGQISLIRHDKSGFRRGSMTLVLAAACCNSVQ
jgi:hypothetical protein